MKQMITEDIGSVIEEALSKLPENSKVYTMRVGNKYDESEFLTRSGNVFPLQTEVFTKEETEALNRFLNQVSADA